MATQNSTVDFDFGLFDQVRVTAEGRYQGRMGVILAVNGSHLGVKLYDGASQGVVFWPSEIEKA
jgi:ribosomal protein L21E